MSPAMGTSQKANKMVEVLIIEFQGIVEDVELYESHIDADSRRDHLILQEYPSIKAYNQALDDCNAQYVVHHFSDEKVR
jgi:hypothetical protein